MTFRQPAVNPGYDFRRKCPCKVGDRVTCITPVEAYHSDYAGNPECHFKPGMVGTVAVIDSPSVRYGPYGEDVSVLVDFDGPEYGGANHRLTSWRVALRHGNIKVISKHACR